MTSFVYASPLGGLLMESDGTSLTALRFLSGDCVARDITAPPELPVFALTARWLDEYFRGGIPAFTPPLKLTGSPFRMAVWDIVARIPYGRTVTYGEIAREIAHRCGLGRMSAQAVGGAVGGNPIPIIVPCHRVVGFDGRLTGYAGGLVRKKKLLDLESGKIVLLE